MAGIGTTGLGTQIATLSEGGGGGGVTSMHYGSGVDGAVEYESGLVPFDLPRMATTFVVGADAQVGAPPETTAWVVVNATESIEIIGTLCSTGERGVDGFLDASGVGGAGAGGSMNGLTGGEGSTNSQGSDGASEQRDVLFRNNSLSLSGALNLDFGATGGAGGFATETDGGAGGQMSGRGPNILLGPEYVTYPQTLPVAFGGGGGGGGGAADGVGGGGGGGGGAGGMIILRSPSITIRSTATLDVSGGPGGNGGDSQGADAGGGGGGAGGSGGLIILVCESLTIEEGASIQYSGGDGGTGGTGSAPEKNGNGGAAGYGGLILQYNPSENSWQSLD